MARKHWITNLSTFDRSVLIELARRHRAGEVQVSLPILLDRFFESPADGPKLSTWRHYFTYYPLPAAGKVAARVEHRLEELSVPYRKTRVDQPGKSNEDDEPKFTKVEKVSDDTLEVLSISDRIRTIADAIAHGEIDELEWYVFESEVTSYECPMKLSKGEDEKGKKLPDKPAVIKLWRIKLRLKRRISRAVMSAADAVMERMKKYSPVHVSYPKLKHLNDPHMLEVGLYDIHFGKLAWAPETGDNYDLSIAQNVYLEAARDMIAYASPYTIEQVVMPIGHDFFHVDNHESKTTAGTRVDSDARLAKILDTGVQAAVKAIDYFAELAPVKILWVPGNHDANTSYYLAAILDAWYRNNKRVTVDRSPTYRKYQRYGRVVLGFTHGCNEKLADLPGIMLHEARALMADADSLEIHHGHFHKAKETVYVNTDTHAGGVRMRCLPSLSGTDAWHYQMGYVGGAHTAEAYLWSKDRGYISHYSAKART